MLILRVFVFIVIFFKFLFDIFKSFSYHNIKHYFNIIMRFNYHNSLTTLLKNHQKGQRLNIMKLPLNPMINNQIQLSVFIFGLRIDNYDMVS
jgi:hypothetical protein